MESAVLKHQPATLLTIPTELCQKIIRYVFLAACAPTSEMRNNYYNDNDTDIHVVFDIKQSQYFWGHGLWGREPMTCIMRVNRQLLSDAIHVLYCGDFTFRFGAGTQESWVKRWVGTIGEKKNLVRRIGVEFGVFLEDLWGYRLNMEERMACSESTRDALATLRTELGGLESVEFRFWFTWMPRMPGGDKERVLAIEALVGLMEVLRGLKITKIVNGRRPDEDTRVGDILRTFQERLEE